MLNIVKHDADQINITGSEMKLEVSANLFFLKCGTPLVQEMKLVKT